MRVNVSGDQFVDIESDKYTFTYNDEDASITIINVGIPGVIGPNLTFKLEDLVKREHDEALDAADLMSLQRRDK